MIRSLIRFLVGAFILVTASPVCAQKATISEQYIDFKTYMFSDPDPVPTPGRIYPYFYFNGYTNSPVLKKWKMVVLENDFIKVFVCPDIGGKVWGAIEKSTGKEFLYFNNVVKFRDVAMRGAWTSGGLEYNFGDIGHIPTCATPVDYINTEYPDGSVSCTVGAIDLPSGTKWSVEIILRPGEAFFETQASWFNDTHLPVTYYHWMNAAAKASGKLEFIYPGNRQIGHGGEIGNWPEDHGRDLSFYENNNFGSYKSYHVINTYSEFFGGYWHDDDFGFGHWSNYDEKPGKKLWIWGLSQQGMIWEPLLTDTDGQYIEFQAGKLFNQAGHSSTYTPFKHKEFAPHDSDVMNEIWFPLKGTGGMVSASKYGILNIEGDTLILSALQALNDDLKIFVDGELMQTKRINLKPLERVEFDLSTILGNSIEVILGEHKLVYSSDKQFVDRPIEGNRDFNWESAYGHYVMGMELEKQRRYPESMESYLLAIKMDAGFLPALSRLALGYYRMMDFDKADQYVKNALAIDTYDGEANYILGLVSSKKEDIATAKSGFSIAMGSIKYRTAGATELASLYMKEGDFMRAILYSNKALDSNSNNLKALQVLAIALRRSGDLGGARITLEKLERKNKTLHFIRFEQTQINPDDGSTKVFKTEIKNEIPTESYLDLAITYCKLGCYEEAIEVLKMAEKNPVTYLWLAYLDSKSRSEYISEALEMPPDFVFPHRQETAEVLEFLSKIVNHWKLNYYLGLIYWNRELVTGARELFEECGFEPDFAPFYLAMAKMTGSGSDQLVYLKRAVEISPEDWRASLALSRFYLNKEEAETAKKTIEPFLKSFPEQAAIGICYAEILNELGEYNSTIKFLENYSVLPFEGATIARDLYHEACIRASLKLVKKSKYKDAIKMAEKASLWPGNLGSGRPYDVDDRMEDFLLGYLYDKIGESAKSKQAYNRIIEYSLPDEKAESSKLILQLIVLRDAERNSEAESMVIRYTNALPENLYIKWAGLMFAGDSNGANQLAQRIIGSNNDIQPYDTQFMDKDFVLLLDMLSALSEYF